MARPGRPVSESYQSVCCSVIQSSSTSSEAAIVGLEEEDDQAPIFSISKSSMDVVMATGPPGKWDPAWTRLDLRRSSSTNTHSEQKSVTLQHMWQQVGSTSSRQLPLTAQIVDVHDPPALSECRTAITQRWSESSCSTHSRSSTPDTVVWKGGSSRPSSLSQDASYPTAPDSPLSKLASPPTTPSPITSPLHTPTSPPLDLLTSPPLTPGTNQQEDLLVSSPAPSPLPSPPQAHTSSTLPPSSPDLLLLTSTEDECFLESHELSFHFPSAKTSSVCSVEENALSDVGCPDDVIEEPGDLLLAEGGGARSPERVFSFLMPLSLGLSCPTRAGGRSSLVSSLSDSRLGDLCRCNLCDITKPPRFELLREEGTMTSKVELVDAEVQTVSPIGSWWHLKRNMSTSNMGSHSILGSPPGSRLNLKSSVGSNSNLVSPSSSMFPVSSGEEEEGHGEDLRWDNNSASSHDLERRRSCLKIQGEQRDELGRRSSMKQVQWDEDGMTWEVHGASLDPEELSMAIQKHLDLQRSPQPLRRSSKKKKAPMPPLISSVVKAMAPELNPTVTINVPSCIQEGGSGEAVEVEDGGGGKKEDTAEVPRRRSRAEGEDTKEEEVYGEEGTSCPKSPSGGSGHGRKRGVIRSLRRPGWCGSSRKTND